MKRFILIIAVVIIGGVYFNHVNNVKALQNMVYIAKSTATATSTLQYLSTTATASSTLTANIINADAVSIQMCNTASSSAAFLDYQVWFSMQSYNEDASTYTWYNESNPSASSNTVTVSPVTRTMSLATSTVRTGNYMCTDDLVTPLGAKQIMVKYSTRVANTGIWMSLVPKMALNP